jgi:adenylate cyclase
LLQSLRQALHRLTLLGVGPEQPGAEQRRIRVTNLTALIGLAISIAYTPQFLILGARQFWPAILVNVLAVLGYSAGLRAHVRGRLSLAAGLIVATGDIEILSSSLLLGRGAGIQYFFFVFPAVIELILPPTIRRGRWLILAISFAGFLAGQYALMSRNGLLGFPTSWQNLLHPISALTTFLTTLVVVMQFRRDTAHAEATALIEHARSESLLLNILPASISARLKDGQESIADGIPACSVLFADIVGFTELSARMQPEALVRLLNRVFSAFDDLCEKHGLEKIKTIGDAYMVASGLPTPRPDHAEAMAAMALDMRAAVAELGDGLGVRIGIHSGPVVAGVIGKRKFSYDVWGDTVNTASRMESHGLRDRIQVTGAFADLVRGNYTVAPRGTVEVKGKGSMETFWLEGR